MIVLGRGFCARAITKEGRAMTVEDVLARLHIATQKDGHGNWDLSNLSIQPEFLSDLVAKLPLETTGSWGGAVTLDLSENRLGPLDEQQLRLLARALKERPWLRVKLGYEVMPPFVVSALKSEGMESAWGTQVSVDRPWEDPVNRRLGESISCMNKSISCLAESNRTVQSMLVKLLGAKLPDSYIKAESDALEHEMAEAVKCMLVDGKVLVASYTWKDVQDGRPGDVDGVVTGKWKGEPVVVICECKNNVQAKYSIAARQVKLNAQRWQDLCSIAAGTLVEGEDISALSEQDIDALSVAELRDRRVLYAVGGNIFPELVCPKITKKLDGMTWICVRMNGMQAEEVKVVEGA